VESGGIKNGIIKGLAIIVVYAYLPLLLLLFFGLTADTPGDALGWARLIALPFLYLLGYLIALVPTLALSIAIMLQDKNISAIGVPLLFMIIYTLLTPFKIPGPMDEAVVLGVVHLTRLRLRRMSVEAEGEKRLQG